jgi:16S rRNA (guanine966-N2)-methyltransferase
VVRIISGECRGRKLRTLRGREVRPTSDRAKETLFDILGDRVAGSRFLDLFAGSGSVGLEAASRGAAEVVLVEGAPSAFRILQKNLRDCRMSGKVLSLCADSQESLCTLANQGKSFDLIFLDPPYQDWASYAVIDLIGRTGLLASGGILIAEHDGRHALAVGYSSLVQVRRKNVGDTVFTFFERRKDATDTENCSLSRKF